MTDLEWARQAPRLRKDINALGLRGAVEQLIGRLFPDQVRVVPMAKTAWAMVDAVAEAHNLNPKYVRSKMRYQTVVAARHEAWFRLHASGFSGPEIAAMFEVDASTVCDARQSFRRKFPELAEAILAASAAVVEVPGESADEANEERSAA